MAKELIIREVIDGRPNEIGRLGGERTLIGRDVSGGIQLQHEGVSRSHGVFSRAKNLWLYMDLDSTNGSWINGVKVSAYSPKIIRAGDTLQLATAIIQLHDGASASGFAPVTPEQISVEQRSLLVLKKERPVDEFPVPERGLALSVGGSDCDISLSDQVEEKLLTVDVVGGQLSATHGNSPREVKINDVVVAGAVTLRDQDQITFEDYLVIVNDPTTSVRIRPRSTGGGMAATAGWAQQGEDRSHRVMSTAFGKTSDVEGSTIESTMGMAAEDLGDIRKKFYDKHGFEISPDDLEKEKGERYAVLEEIIIMVMAIGFAGAIVGISIWWFFFK